jgi:hypothetical protein
LRTLGTINHARNDDDLKALRPRPEFQQYLTRLEEKAKAAPAKPVQP